MTLKTFNFLSSMSLNGYTFLNGLVFPRFRVVLALLKYRNLDNRNFKNFSITLLLFPL